MVDLKMGLSKNQEIDSPAVSQERQMKLNNGTAKLEPIREQTDQHYDRTMRTLSPAEQEFIKKEVSEFAYLHTGNFANIQNLHYDPQTNQISATVNYAHHLTIDLNEHGFSKSPETQTLLSELQSMERAHLQLSKDCGYLGSMIEKAIDSRDAQIANQNQQIEKAQSGIGGLWNRFTGQIPEPVPSIEEIPLTMGELTRALSIAETKNEHFLNLREQHYPEIQKDARASIRQLDEMVQTSATKLENLTIETKQAVDNPMLGKDQSLTPSLIHQQLSSQLTDLLQDIPEMQEKLPHIITGMQNEVDRYIAKGDMPLTEHSTIDKIQLLSGNGLLVSYSDPEKGESAFMLNADYLSQYQERDEKLAHSLIIDNHIEALANNPDVQKVLDGYNPFEQDILIEALAKSCADQTNDNITIQSIQLDENHIITLNFANVDGIQGETITLDTKATFNAFMAEMDRFMASGGLLGDRSQPFPEYQMSESEKEFRENKQAFDEKMAALNAHIEKVQNMSFEDYSQYIYSPEAIDRYDPQFLKEMQSGVELIQHLDATRFEFSKTDLALAVGETVAKGGYDWAVKLSANVIAIPAPVLGMNYEEIRNDFMQRYDASYSQNHQNYMGPMNEKIGSFMQSVYENAEHHYGPVAAKEMARGLEALTDLLGVSAIYTSPIGQSARRGMLRHQEMTSFNNALKADLNNPTRVAQVAESMSNHSPHIRVVDIEKPIYNIEPFGVARKIDDAETLIHQRQAANQELMRGNEFDIDLNKVNITRHQIELMQEKRLPLGFKDELQFAEFKKDLDNALTKSGLNDAEVGLKGTATTFYSENPSKPLRHHWDADPNALGDYDLNISSRIMINSLDEINITPHEQYGIFRTKDINNNFPELDAFQRKWGEILNRDVNFVGYPKTDPVRDSTEYLLRLKKD